MSAPHKILGRNSTSQIYDPDPRISMREFAIEVLRTIHPLTSPSGVRVAAEATISGADNVEHGGRSFGDKSRRPRCRCAAIREDGAQRGFRLAAPRRWRRSQ